ncbi:MAG: sulfite exporter TauE/SafE family protein [Candidatus Latescibacteria bacterium]|nr:sulfite exporter TauE/SafE family protein [Candidatus Latescibacterota bacterium]
MRLVRSFPLCCLLSCLLIIPRPAFTHPLGNFTVNLYSRLELSGPAAGQSGGTIRLVYIVDMAEIPTFQALQGMDTDENGVTSEDEKTLFLTVKVDEVQQGLRLWADQQPVQLMMRSRQIEFPPGQGGLLTLRMRVVFEALVPGSASGKPATAGHEVEYRDENEPDRLGWREIVVQAMPGVTIQTSTVPDRDESDELRRYPQDMLSSPLNVRTARVAFVFGAENGGWSGIGSLGQRAAERSKDTFADLVSARKLSPRFILWALLVACGLGALHALSPGHGKTIVGAYLVGARGTATHALFLGLTVTATHTSGVFALGLITLYASEFILPERLYPWLSVASGVIVAVLGVSLFFSRLRNLFGQDHDHHHHTHDDHDHVHDHGHSHLPPGADGRPVTWRSLLALGVSGGLLPCPSALVVLLGAIAMHRVGFGLLLIVAFSLGLAGVLTGIGLVMVRARRVFDGMSMRHPVVSGLPVVSAGVISIAGLFIVGQGLVQAGVLNAQAVFDGLTHTAIGSTLGLGFVLGLKHALDADHLVAVTTIVSERKGVFGSSLVGALWGLGHTAALLVVGLVVVALNLRIPDRLALALEFAVAVMLVVLGVDLIRKLIRGATLHVHSHEHGAHWHVHPHLHEGTAGTDAHSHHPVRLGTKPFFIGMVHGLAGSAALMLLVLVTIPSRTLALIYIGVFGIGSIGGMLVMSTLVGLPFAMTAQRFSRLNMTVRALAGVFSVGFGLFLAWQIGGMLL